MYKRLCDVVICELFEIKNRANKEVVGMSNHDDIIKQLQKNPVYQISMSSIELFHSNFWKWMFTSYPSSIQCFFFDIEFITNLDSLVVKREYVHTDLAIIDGSDIYLIENKIKSTPDKVQLMTYEKARYGGATFRKGIITGFVDPGFDDLQNWVYMSYREIANKMEVFLNSQQEAANEDTKFDMQLIRRYVEMIRFLDMLVQNSLNNGGIYNLNNGLDQIGFNVVFRRLLGSIMVNQLINTERFQRLSEKYEIAKNKDTGKDISLSINNSQLTFSIDFITNIENVYIGVQLGDYVYRKHVGIWFETPRSISEANSKKDKDILAKEAFEDLVKIFPNWLDKQKPYNKFITGQYSYIYQKDEDIKNDCLLDDLYDRILTDLEYLSKCRYLKLK